MPRYEIVPATEQHAIELAATMRLADVMEVHAACGLQPHEVLRNALAASRDTKAGLVDGRVACLFGVSSATILSTWGHPWLLGSPEIETHAKAFLRRNKAYISAMRERYSILVNFVDARNTVAIKWLGWLGFSVLPAIPYGPYGMPFHPFVMRS